MAIKGGACGSWHVSSGHMVCGLDTRAGGKGANGVPKGVSSHVGEAVFVLGEALAG